MFHMLRYSLAAIISLCSGTPDCLACLFSESQRWIGGGEGDDGVVLRRAAVVGVPRADRAGAADARGAAQGAADRGTEFPISGHGATCA